MKSKIKNNVRIKYVVEKVYSILNEPIRKH